MPLRLDSREAVLARTIEIFDAKISQHKAEIEMLSSTETTKEQVISHLRAVDPRYRDIFDLTVTTKQAIEGNKEDYLRELRVELQNLKDVQKMVSSLANDDSLQNSLDVTATLFCWINMEQATIDSHNNLVVIRRQRLEKEAKAQNKNSQQKTKNKELLAKKEEPYLPIESRTRLKTYEEVRDLLLRNVLPQECTDFAHKHAEIKFFNNEQGDVSFKINIKQSFARKAVEQQNASLKKLSEKYVALKSKMLEPELLEGRLSTLKQMSDEGKQYTEASNKQKERDALTIRGVSKPEIICARHYLKLLQVPEAIREAEESLDNDIAIIEEFDRGTRKEIEDKYKAQAKEAAAQAAIRLAEIETKQIEQQEKEQLIAAEKQKQQDIARIAKEAAQQEIEEEKQRRKQEIIQYKAEVESNRIKAEVERRKAQIQKFGAIEKNVSDSKAKPTLRFDDTAIAKNSTELRRLFDTFKPIKWDDAVALIRDLGGEIDDKSGSSHQRIIFRGCLVSDLQLIETTNKPTTMPMFESKSGIAKKYEVAGSNLILLRNAIAKLLPENWRELENANQQPDIKYRLNT